MRVEVGDRAIETSEDKRWLNPREAARRLGVSLSTFRSYPIRRFKRGRIVRYDIQDLDSFCVLNTVGPALKRAS